MILASFLTFVCELIFHLDYVFKFMFLTSSSRIITTATISAKTNSNTNNNS